jgi:formate hydrogenlyase subunit 4
MSAVLALLSLLLHAGLMLAAAPLVPGLVRTLKARLLGRRGPPLLQPWRDIARLLRKEPVVADNASFVTIAAPSVVLAATAAAGLLVPSFALGMASAPAADLLVVAGLLGLSRVTLALAAMDAGTGFGGIGASREMTFSAFAEPALLLVALTFALLTGTTNLDVTAMLLRDGGLGLRVSIGMVLVAMALIALAENGRMPADNPATHLELTMVHEAMLLEYSGRHLAFLEIAASLRLLIWLGLFGTLFTPFLLAPAGANPFNWLPAIAGWAARCIIACAALAALEVSIAKMRVFRVPEFIGAALLLGLLAAVYLFVSTGFA